MGTALGEIILCTKKNLSHIPSEAFLRKEFAPCVAILIIFVNTIPSSERVLWSTEACRKPEKLFPFVRIMTNMEVYQHAFIKIDFFQKKYVRFKVYHIWNSKTRGQTV